MCQVAQKNRAPDKSRVSFNKHFDEFPEAAQDHALTIHRSADL